MRYENNWTSLNARPVPGWFEDAKLGIFIHWGLYSVPAFAPKGCYAEWYGCHCDAPKDSPIDRQYYDFQQKHYPGRTYADFVADFRAECFDAAEWIDLFERSGARYMNLVSKHHDGFCMYRSKYAPNWNSFDVGPHRDFCRELADACAGTPVRFGVYHSVYEWFHPLYLESPERYATEHLIPMLKELVTAYEPNTLFTDGEWEHPSAVWHSTDFLQWLYNDSPVRDVIVPNDRWGSETRGRLGGNLTTEYGWIGAADGSEVMIDRVAEECRGIGASFGVNRFEKPEDYLSPKALVDTFVDLLARGSNLLLNVGPTADGRIPVIMQERLEQLGAWLAVNGEAVYGSRKYAESADPDVAYTKKNVAVYAFLKTFPHGEKTLDAVPYAPGARAALLGCDAPVATFDAGGRLALRFPALVPSDLRGAYTWCVRLTGV